MQTTWLRLVEHLDSLRDPDRLGSWLMTTVRRQIMRAVLSAHRAGPRRGGAGRHGPGRDPTRSPEELVTAVTGTTRTKAALGRLPARNRALLTMLMEPPS